MNDLADLITALDGDAPERRAAQTQLVTVGEPAVAPLIEALETEEGHRAWAAAEVLGLLHDRRAFEPLLRAVRSTNPLVGGMAVKALLLYEDQDIVPLLVEALPSAHIITQQTIIVSLQKIPDGRAVAMLVDLLGQIESPTMRCAIIQTLGALGDAQAVPAIRAFQDDPDHHIREWAAVALKQLDALDGRSPGSDIV